MLPSGSERPAAVARVHDAASGHKPPLSRKSRSPSGGSVGRTELASLNPDCTSAHAVPNSAMGKSHLAPPAHSARSSLPKTWVLEDELRNRWRCRLLRFPLPRFLPRCPRPACSHNDEPPRTPATGLVPMPDSRRVADPPPTTIRRALNMGTEEAPETNKKRAQRAHEDQHRGQGAPEPSTKYNSWQTR